jgi:hypothetical protein
MRGYFHRPRPVRRLRACTALLRVSTALRAAARSLTDGAVSRSVVNCRAAAMRLVVNFTDRAVRFGAGAGRLAAGRLGSGRRAAGFRAGAGRLAGDFGAAGRRVASFADAGRFTARLGGAGLVAAGFFGGGRRVAFFFGTGAGRSAVFVFRR